MGNRTFFKNVTKDKMSLKDIFSDVMRKHTPEESASVFIAGTSLTTPREEEMLSGWLKPFLFARFFVTCVIGLLILWVLRIALGYGGASYLLMLGIACVVPMSTLLLVWEMHIPRNISLPEVIKIVGAGGVLSIFVAIIGFNSVGDMSAVWAGLVEEPAKLVIIYYLLKKKNRVYILDGILLGVAVGTGFAVFESLIYTMSAFAQGGELGGIIQALVRAFSAIGGHGFYAGLYGGGLVMAKGRDMVSPKHLTSVSFLKYFVLSIAFHAFHNMGIDLGLPKFFGGILWTEWIIEAIIAIYIFLRILKIGVNQVVVICMEKNGGRVTQAVNRDLHMRVGQPVKLEIISGPYLGKVFPLQMGQMLTIGRAPGKNGIELPAYQNVSSIHCQIRVEEGKIGVKDLNSTNGTYIGEQRLIAHQEAFVGDGMIFYLGDKTCGLRVRIQ